MDPILKIIADNPTLLEAAKKHILSKFDDAKPRDAETMTNEQLGALVRARLTGRDLVDKAFHEIQQLNGEAPQSLKNPAR